MNFIFHAKRPRCRSTSLPWLALTSLSPRESHLHNINVRLEGNESKVTWRGREGGIVKRGRANRQNGHQARGFCTVNLWIRFSLRYFAFVFYFTVLFFLFFFLNCRILSNLASARISSDARVLSRRRIIFQTSSPPDARPSPSI